MLFYEISKCVLMVLHGKEVGKVSARSRQKVNEESQNLKISNINSGGIV